MKGFFFLIRKLYLIYVGLLFSQNTLKSPTQSSSDYLKAINFVMSILM